MKYQVLLCDLDDTLFDFHAGEAIAIRETFAHFDIPATEENISAYLRANTAQWKLLERGETTQEKLRVDRFANFLKDIALNRDANALSEDYILTLGAQCIPLTGAVELCQAVSQRMPIYLVTNGIARIQRSRIKGSPIEPYITGLIISEEIGKSKPDPAMVHEALRLAGVTDTRRAVLLGDSITSDIGAANNAGIDSILYTGGRKAPAGHGATYVASTLEKACSIVLGE